MLSRKFHSANRFSSSHAIETDNPCGRSPSHPLSPARTASAARSVSCFIICGMNRWIYNGWEYIIDSMYIVGEGAFVAAWLANISGCSCNEHPAVWQKVIKFNTSQVSQLAFSWRSHLSQKFMINECCRSPSAKATRSKLKPWWKYLWNSPIRLLFLGWVNLFYVTLCYLLTTFYILQAFVSLCLAIRFSWKA